MNRRAKIRNKELDISDSDPVNLLWTGGWDSTFRLLQIVLEEKKKVQPYYVVRPQECAGKEIDTIHNIRRQIFRDHPYTRKLFMGTILIDDMNIESDSEITNEYKRIAKKKHINKQYEILARFCKQLDIKNMELSVLSRETFSYFETNSTIFKYFEYPILGLTKLKMAEVAKQKGWEKYMKMTWFCRRPKGDRPCGLCGPCTDVMIDGLYWRLPLRSRLLAYIQLPFRKWWRKNYLKQENGINKHIKKLLKHRT